MARTFLYQYLVGEETRTVVKPDPDETMVIPEKGEIIVRNGKTWRVVSVKLQDNTEPGRTSQSPMEIRVSLMSLCPR